ncbi:MAG: hypothetical protein GWO04_21125, partial [Actinobacteria bacterium]|nr:hypothetical protein [Actinomycetota bacterium]
TLLVNAAAPGDVATGNTFDFYTKSGNHYQYIHGGDNEWVLKSIEDPNGNRTELFYVGEPGDLRVSQVRDAAGRTLKLEYEKRAFAFWDAEVITRVTAPGGVEMRFEYDSFGNLTRASREALASER